MNEPSLSVFFNEIKAKRLQAATCRRTGKSISLTRMAESFKKYNVRGCISDQEAQSEDQSISVDLGRTVRGVCYC